MLNEVLRLCSVGKTYQFETLLYSKSSLEQPFPCPNNGNWIHQDFYSIFHQIHYLHWCSVITFLTWIYTIYYTLIGISSNLASQISTEFEDFCVAFVHHFRCVVRKTIGEQMIPQKVTPVPKTKKVLQMTKKKQRWVSLGILLQVLYCW